SVRGGMRLVTVETLLVRRDEPRDQRRLLPMAPDALSFARREGVWFVAADACVVGNGMGLRGLGMARGARRAGLLRRLVSMMAIHAALRARVAAVLRSPLL